GAELLALLALAGQRSQEPLALLGALQDVLQRPGDPAQVRQQVAAAFQELLDPGAGGRRDLPADLDLGLVGGAALDLAVLVPAQSGRLGRGARPVAQARGPS